MGELKRTFLSVVLGLTAFSVPTQAVETELSAAHGYVESVSGKVGVGGINIPGESRDDSGRPQNVNSLTSWTDANACAVYYFHHPAATVSHSIKLNVKLWNTAKFRLTITDPNSPDTPVAKMEFSVTGSGKEAEKSIGDVTFPRSAYYRYKLECLSGNSSINSIRSFKFNTSATEASYAANYLSSPSVHLNSWNTSDSKAPTGDAFDWCFMEIMIPSESDIVGTYAEAIGALNGYMGIQMNGYDSNGKPLHDVLFSMWDDGSTDEDPNLPEYLRAGAVDWDAQTTVNRFGNEGTGVQTYRRGEIWTPGRYVQFITNCRPETTSYTTTTDGKTTVHEQHNMLVSTWFNALDGKGWQYMATVRKRNSSTYYSSWYSFLENYNAATGQAQRRAYYRNGYARSRHDGKWYNFNRVGFGHTDGGSEAGARSDYGQGATDNTSERTFFMQTGGYVNTRKAASAVTLADVNTPVDTININPLERRVKEAIAAEKRRAAEDELFAQNILDKNGWTVVSKSSEETSGEGSNGRAQQIVDGDDNTYWHPQWKSSTAQLPHTIVVDMQATKNVGGFQIKQGDNSNRYIKAYDIYGSTDNKSWTLLCSDDNAPVKSEFRNILDAAVDIRYFKIVVREVKANDGPFVRIYEVDVASGNTIVSPSEPDEFEGKFKCDFEDGRTLPDGSYADAGWAISQRDFNGQPNVYLLANRNQNADDRFVLPLMKIEDGERMAVDVCRTNYYYGGSGVYLNVYYSADRKNWTLARQIKGSELSSKRAISNTYVFGEQSTFYIDNIPSGNYYIAFGAGYTAIDNIRGYQKADIKHDWVITDVDMPATGKENYSYTASATLRNATGNTEAAGSYTARLIVNGETVATADAVELGPNAVHKFTFSYTPRTTGTVSAYIDFKNSADFYVKQTDLVSVTFEAETDAALVKVGDEKDDATNVPIYWVQADSKKTSYAEKRGGYTDMLFKPERLAKFGIPAGTKITSVVFKGTASSAKTFGQLYLEARVAAVDADAFQPGENLADISPIYVYNYDYRYEEDSHSDIFKTTAGGEVTTTITLPQPIVWDGKSAIRVYTHIYGSEYCTVTYKLDSDNSDRSAYYRMGSSTTYSDNNVPVAYFGIDTEASTLSGKVTYASQPVAGAVVRLQNGDVSYEATTDAFGDYTISVTRSDLKYQLSVAAAGFAEYIAPQPVVVNGNVTRNIELSLPTAVNGVTVDDQHPVDVYSVDGKLVMKNATSFTQLKHGVYVVNGVKIVK